VLSNFRIETYVEHFENIYVEMLRNPNRCPGWLSIGSLRSISRMLFKGAGVFLRNLAAPLCSKPSSCVQFTGTGRS